MGPGQRAGEGRADVSNRTVATGPGRAAGAGGPERGFDRFQEDYDRRQRVERLRAAGGVRPDRRPAYVGPLGDPQPHVAADSTGASLAWMLEEDQRLLAKLEGDYDRNSQGLRQAQAHARQAARSDGERVVIDHEYEQKQAELTRTYQTKRRAILGWPPQQPTAPTTGPAGVGGGSSEVR